MKKLIVGNWKMNTDKQGATALAKGLASSIGSVESDAFDMVICPPTIWMCHVFDAIDGSVIELGAQDCHWKDSGAYTGNVSAAMIKDAGCDYVILGHSERRSQHHESDEFIRQKAVKALDNDLITIICVGEQEGERDLGRHEEVVGRQLKNSLPDDVDTQKIVIAYEPVWAIGTGKTATLDDIKSMHKFIRDELTKMVDDANNIRILYGGSVKPTNAADIMAIDNVDGVLVGGASLTVEDFTAIAKSASVN